jgi:hypothetical protein
MAANQDRAMPELASHELLPGANQRFRPLVPTQNRQLAGVGALC